VITAEVAHESPGTKTASVVRGWLKRGDLPLFMPYLYVVLLGGTIFALQPSLIDGSGAVDARFSLVLSLALVAYGQTLVLLTRGVDLSVGGVISVISALLATHLAANGPLIIPELLAVVVGGVLVGCLNGFMISYTSIQPFVVTLATWYIFDGLAFALLPVEGGTVSKSLVSAVTGSFIGVPKSVWAVVALFVLWRLMRPTRFVTDLIAIGSDEGRARLLGVRVKRRKIQAYATSAFFASLAGIYFTAQAQSGSPDGGDQYILNSIAAVVLGGTSIFGGKGSAASSIAGAIAFLMIPDLVFALNLTSFWSVFFQGFILILAVTFNSVIQIRARRAA
jgi:ribose transport system permease protein